MAPGFRPHSVAAAASPPGRPCRPGAHEQKLPAAQTQLAVGADVQENRGLLPCVQVRQQQPRRNVAAQIIGLGREAEHIAAQFEPQLPGGVNARVEKHRRIGVLKHKPGVAAQEKVNHGGVAPHGQGRNFLRLRKPCGHLSDQAVDVPGDQKPQRLQILPVFLYGKDTVQNVQTEGHLAVHAAHISKDLSRQHIHQLHFQGGAADVQRQTQKPVRCVPRLYPDDVRAPSPGQRVTVTA